MQANLDSKPYKILHLGKYYPPYRGGMETYLRDLAIRQVKLADVDVIVSSSTSQAESSVVEGVHITRVARLTTMASQPLCPGLVSAIRRTPADIVHMHMPNPATALAFLLSSHKGKLIISHHADTLGRGFLRTLTSPVVKRAMGRASAIIASSQGYLQSSPELAPYRKKCHVIHLGMDLHGAGIHTAGTLKENPISASEPLILSIGRLVPYKGFDVAIRAMQHINAKLCIIGKGPLAQTLQALIESCGVQDKVQLLGNVPDVKPYLNAASIFVLPSVTRAEAFGLVQLEAMYTGVPVINTSLDSGVAEVSLDGQTGFTIPPGDEAAMTNAIQTLLDRPDLREKFGQAGKLRVCEEFDADLMTERTFQLYEQVLSGTT